VDFYQHLKNPEKYKGSRPLTMRSGWEIQYCQYLDRRTAVVEWSSESIVIMYISPLDGKPHRYFTDFWCKYLDREGNYSELLIEIKPAQEMSLAENPTRPKRMTKGAIDRIQAAVKNGAKWKYARHWCEQERKKGRKISFVIITENEFPFK
jgi:hypothetical protein